MTLEDYCKQIELVQTPEALWELCVGFSNGYGITHASYHHFPPPGEASSGYFRVFATGYDPSWVRDYVKRRFYLIDPIPALASTATKPFRWSEKLAQKPLATPEAKFMEWLKGHDVTDGLAVQVFGPGGRNGLVALGFGDDPPALTEETIRVLQCCYQIGHLRYIALDTENRDAPVELTTREREVLFWVAKGKSNSVIAAIMGISNHTVDAYLRRIYLKLGVTDRISAAIKGIGAGLIAAADPTQIHESDPT